MQLFKMEDVSMGMWVEQFNSSRPVEYLHNLKFCQFGCIDDYYTAHYQSPRQMICMWDKLQQQGKPQCCNMRWWCQQLFNDNVEIWEMTDLRLWQIDRQVLQLQHHLVYILFGVVMIWGFSCFLSNSFIFFSLFPFGSCFPPFWGWMIMEGWGGRWWHICADNNVTKSRFKQVEMNII